MQWRRIHSRQRADVRLTIERFRIQEVSGTLVITINIYVKGKFDVLNWA